MVYTSRVVGFGIHKGTPLVVFTLASKSVPFREFRINPVKKKINVFPKKGYESHETNQDPEVDNYSCIRAGQLPDSSKYAIAFNGHMCKRVEANLKDGLNPLMALDLTLLEFRGLYHDARIGCIAYRDAKGTVFFLGTNDTERAEKRVCRYPNDRVSSLEDSVVFIHDTDTRFEKVHRIRTGEVSPEGVARYLHSGLFDGKAEHNISTGVALLNQGEITLGVYNSET